ncbi:tetratricopeptide repeat protein [Vreelandella neptunia]|uniref:O-linked N-acetylglucosamine transferase, SPINDLY family protein n=1 Tax=Vreelandella neptunia TaxID=115551 RepID=UPI003159C765
MAKPARNKSLRRVRTTKGGNFITLEEAERDVHKKPDDADAWRRLGVIQMRKGKLHDAIASLEKSEQLNPNEHNNLAWLGYTHTQLGNMVQAEEYLNRVLEENPQHLQALIGLVALQFHSGRSLLALETLETAQALSPDNLELLEYKGQSFMRLARYEEALEVYHRIIEHHPDNMMAWNAAGVVYRDIGDFDRLVEYHKKAMSLDKKSSLPFSNLLTAVHYSPDWSSDEIAELCKEWQVRYAPRQPPARPVPSNLSPAKTLRIGMFSDGFRSHPVGNMIIESVERLHPGEVELYCYATHSEEDHITQRFKKVAAKWQLIKHLPSDTFAQCVRDDGIDILIDMSGHNSGSRAYAVALQPAPLLVKWVGGLINTTGIEAIDYLLSDSIETPPGEDVDQGYVEKLVRLPDDYIVYHIPRNVPPVTLLPATKNGYITLGCFNNPTKLNDVTLKEWAKLMHELPDSRLFLKSRPYTSEALCERIYATLEHEGIVRERVLIEGPSQHLKLLEAYGKVDIALDPWPYSGGLTTCESLLMGVPVVTLPGPTFAGRHSATHLVNAGLPELVVDNWEQYRERVIELASDLESLATIRTHLRDILKQSPVCDGARFAKHLTVTLRAIWQRYCEGKAPEALTFNKDGQAWFKGESEPLDIVVQEVKSTQQQGGFNWEIQGQVVTIDNACKVLRDRALSLMIKSRAFAIIAFDPQSLVQKPEVYAHSDNIQLFQHALLGDGQPATLHACMAPTLSSTLKPLPAEQQPIGKRDGTRLLTTLPINTIALDSIEGISLDWLVLDGLSDAATILEHGKTALIDTLLIEVSAVFQPTHERQPSLAELQHWASRHGFRFYCLNAPSYISHLPESVSAKKRQATELESADAIFIPSHERMASLTDNQRTKLAFLLHTVYRVKDMAYELLAGVDEEKAQAYLVEENFAVESIKAEEAMVGASADDGEDYVKTIIPVLDI